MHTKPEEFTFDGKNIVQGMMITRNNFQDIAGWLSDEHPSARFSEIKFYIKYSLGGRKYAFSLRTEPGGKWVSGLIGDYILIDKFSKVILQPANFIHRMKGLKKDKTVNDKYILISNISENDFDKEIIEFIKKGYSIVKCFYDNSFDEKPHFLAIMKKRRPALRK